MAHGQGTARARQRLLKMVCGQHLVLRRGVEDQSMYVLVGCNRVKKRGGKENLEKKVSQRFGVVTYSSAQRSATSAWTFIAPRSNLEEVSVIQIWSRFSASGKLNARYSDAKEWWM